RATSRESTSSSTRPASARPLWPPPACSRRRLRSMPAATPSPSCWSGAGGSRELTGSGFPHPHLVEVDEEVGGVLVHPHGPGPEQLVVAVATREQPHAQESGPDRGEHVPNA